MGLNTDFFGTFVLDRPLTAEHKAILDDFAEEEHELESGRDGKPPTLYCQWVPTEDGIGLEWDGAEKFYYSVAWLEYLIAHFLKPWGYVLNGSVTYVGRTLGTAGTIYAKDNVVTDIPKPPA